MTMNRKNVSERVLLVMVGMAMGFGLSWLLGARADAGGREFDRLVNRGRVDQVGSGHGFELDDDREVRYQGMRSPYDNEMFHEEAQRRNLELVQHKTVNLRFDAATHDRKGRMNAYVFLEDGTFVNLMLVREGYGFARLTPDVEMHREELLAAQREAMREGVGLWGQLKAADEREYIASAKYAEFHRPDCEISERLDTNDRQIMENRNAAFGRGYAPCNKCLP